MYASLVERCTLVHTRRGVALPAQCVFTSIRVFLGSVTYKYASVSKTQQLSGKRKQLEAARSSHMHNLSIMTGISRLLYLPGLFTLRVVPLASGRGTKRKRRCTVRGMIVSPLIPACALPCEDGNLIKK
jgi:hypothetical protein